MTKRLYLDHNLKHKYDLIEQRAATKRYRVYQPEGYYGIGDSNADVFDYSDEDSEDDTHNYEFNPNLLQRAATRKEKELGEIDGELRLLERKRKKAIEERTNAVIPPIYYENMSIRYIPDWVQKKRRERVIELNRELDDISKKTQALQRRFRQIQYSMH